MDIRRQLIEDWCGRVQKKAPVTVLEDRSPYFVRCVFDTIPQIVEIAQAAVEQPSYVKSFDIVNGPLYEHRNFLPEPSRAILNLLPWAPSDLFQLDRVAVFETPGGGGVGIHKDGIDETLSFNILTEVHDSLCETAWYDDSVIAPLNLVEQGFPYSRNVWPNHRGLADSGIRPSCTICAQPGEMIVFNTNIYHSWANHRSPHRRRLLTIRPWPRMIDFASAVRVLF